MAVWVRRQTSAFSWLRSAARILFSIAPHGFRHYPQQFRTERGSLLWQAAGVSWIALLPAIHATIE
jgi:hypothetical protein